MSKTKETTLKQLRKSVEKESEFVDEKPYSHNIISLLLREIDSKFGKKAANETIEMYDLESLGWGKRL